VTLGRADGATRNVWVSTLAAAIDHSDQPVILVARGLACMAVTWWAALERPLYGDPVVGALLVTPPNVDIAHEDLRMVGFGPAPKLLMPFPSVVIASRNDPHMDFAGARLLSSFWGSQCIDGGHIGSADGYADLGAWSHGQHALDWLESNAGGMRQSPTKHANIFDIIPPRNHAAQGYDLSL
jgi:predicted alpha/beta hydrolase family esterase